VFIDDFERKHPVGRILPVLLAPDMLEG